MSILHADHLTVRYGNVTALDDVTLTIPAGRSAVIGPNGAGKSTLLAVLAGVHRPDRGRVRLDGRDITRLSDHRRARLGLARTFQHPAIAAGLTVADNLAVARAADRTATGVDVAALAEQTGLLAAAHLPAGLLPYGRQRLLEVLIAVSARPQVLLLDEPTAGLDRPEIAALADLLRALPEQVATLLVDHDTRFVFDLAEHVTVLARGQVLAAGTPDTVRADEQVRQVYLAEPLAAPHAEALPAAAQRLVPHGTATAGALLHVRGLHATRGAALVLHGVDLTVRAGAVTAVIGRNGAGKTTLIEAITDGRGILAGDVLLDSRTVRGGLVTAVDGPPVLQSMLRSGRRPATSTAMPRHQLQRAGVGLVPQGRGLFATLTVAEHLAVADRSRAGGRRGPRAGLPAWLTALFPELLDRLGHLPRQLSGGEQQMLAIARALAGRPTVLLLDEPAEGLAPKVVTRLAGLLADLTADGIGVLLAEQHLGLVTTVADEVVALDAGHVVDRLDRPAMHAAPQRLHKVLLATVPSTSEARVADVGGRR